MNSKSKNNILSIIETKILVFNLYKYVHNTKTKNIKVTFKLYTYISFNTSWYYQHEDQFLCNLSWLVEIHFKNNVVFSNLKRLLNRNIEKYGTMF